MQKWTNQLRQFIADTMNELRKCSWPERRELYESTILVIVAVMILALFVALVDWMSLVAINRLIIR
jgi:preprotein translocase subunit SecE